VSARVPRARVGVAGFGATARVLAAALFIAALAFRFTPPQAASAATPAWLDRFNQWRIASSLPPLTENTTWDQGDYDHSLYMVKDDQVTHYELSTLPYYTVDGDTAARYGNIQVSSTTTFTDPQAIDWWMGAPFHAMGMLDPRLTSTGFGSYREVKSGWQAGFSLDVLRGNSFTGGSFPVFFPGNGSTVPLTSYSGNEFPDPLQACPGYATPTGLPVFVEVGGNVATSVSAHSFTGNGTPLAHCVIDSSNPAVGSSLTYRGGAILIPQAPLAPGVNYTVSMTVNGSAYSWSFTVTNTGVITAGCPLNGFVAGDFNGDGKVDLGAAGPGGSCILASSGTTFAAPNRWSTTPFYGTVTTLSGDVNGDGKSDLVAVNLGQAFVETSSGIGFNPPVQWSTMPFYGSRGTFVADLNGDGKADLIAVNDHSVWAMMSNGSGFSAPTQWSGALFYGTVATRAADVNGDGKADIIAVNPDSTWVMTSNGAGLNAPALWSSKPFYGSVSTTAADVTGDGKADLVAVNGASTWVMASTGTAFASPGLWSNTAFYGQISTMAACVGGNKTADVVAINSNSVWVMTSTGTGLAAPVMWLSGLP
jgi:uncharacterized protein YkwD